MIRKITTLKDTITISGTSGYSSAYLGWKILPAMQDFSKKELKLKKNSYENNVQNNRRKSSTN